MLTISGSAQFTVENGKFSCGDKHLFTLFSVEENFEDNLGNIENFLNNLGWDDIFIEQTELVNDSNAIEHSILKQAYEKAEIEGLSVVINNSPLACEA